MIDLKKLKNLCEAATPGPWLVYDAYSILTPNEEEEINTSKDDDAAFIAASREAVPELIAMVEEAYQKGITDKFGRLAALQKVLDGETLRAQKAEARVDELDNENNRLVSLVYEKHVYKKKLQKAEARVDELEGHLSASHAETWEELEATIEDVRREVGVEDEKLKARLKLYECLEHLGEPRFGECDECDSHNMEQSDGPVVRNNMKTLDNNDNQSIQAWQRGEGQYSSDILEIFLYHLIRDTGFGKVNRHLRNLEDITTVKRGHPCDTLLPCEHGVAQAKESCARLRRMMLEHKEQPSSEPAVPAPSSQPQPYLPSCT